MNTSQAGNVRRGAAIFAGLVLLNLSVGWLARNFDELTHANAGAFTAGSAADDTRQRASANGGAQAPRQEARDRAGLDKTDAAASAQARTSSPGPAQDKRGVSPAIGRALTGIIENLNAERYDEAQTQLDAIMTGELMSQMTPFELSRLYQLSFNLNMRNENYEAAQADLQAAIESGGLNEQELRQMTYQHAQLFVQMEDYEKAADSLELWLAQPGQKSPGAYYLLAASYYYQDKFDDARDHMETLFSMPGEKQEGWYSMMASLYLQHEDYAKARGVLEQMVQRFDNDTYRKQLEGVNKMLEAGR